MKCSSDPRRLACAAFVSAALGACVYEAPPDVTLVQPPEGVFYSGDPVTIEFSSPIEPDSLVVRVWPDNRDIELEFLPDTVPLLDACTVATSPCAGNAVTVADDGLSAELRFDPAGVGRPDVPLLLEVAEGLRDAETGIETGTRLLFNFQFKPVEQLVDPVDFDQGYYVVLSVIEQPVPTIMTLLAHIIVGENNRVALAGAEADLVDDDLAPNTTNAAELIVDESDQGFVIFAYASLRESGAGERFFETDPFVLELRLGPIIATVQGTRMTGKVLDDAESGHDRIEGTMSYEGILLDVGSGEPYLYEPGSATFVAAWAPPEDTAPGVPDICGDQCGAATAQCFPPDGFPGDGFCTGEGSGEGSGE